MQNLKFLAIIIALFTLLGCPSDDDNNDNNSSNTPTVIQDIVMQGTWIISYYYDTDHDATSNFSGYNFIFGSNNALTASNGTNTYTGIWNITDSNSNDDSISDLHFNILFNSPTNFSELTDDWEILSKSNTEIRLRDVSGGNGGTDYLTFTKN